MDLFITHRMVLIAAIFWEFPVSLDRGAGSAYGVRWNHDMKRRKTMQYMILVAAVFVLAITAFAVDNQPASITKNSSIWRRLFLVYGATL